MLISIPPQKYAVASVVGFVKGKNAIHMARSCMGAAKELRRAEIFGAWLLRFKSWSG
jgi:hypothetical protein